jgi:hypothetical protein
MNIENVVFIHRFGLGNVEKNVREQSLFAILRHNFHSQSDDGDVRDKSAGDEELGAVEDLRYFDYWNTILSRSEAILTKVQLSTFEH